MYLFSVDKYYRAFMVSHSFVCDGISSYSPETIYLTPPENLEHKTLAPF